MHGIRRMVIAGSLLVLPLLALSVGAAQNEIYGVNVVPGEDIVRIEISKAGDVTFNAFMMSEPDRLVINCVGATYNVPWQEKVVQSSLVHKVRTSQFQMDPLVISRIVADLSSPVEYRMYAEGSKEIIEITKPGVPAQSAEAAETAMLLEPPSAPVEPQPAAAQPLVQAQMGPMLPYLPAPAVSEDASTPAAAELAPAEPAPAEPVPAIAEAAPSAWLPEEPAASGTASGIASNVTSTEEDNP